VRSRAWCARLALGLLLVLLLTPGGCAGRPESEPVTLVFKYSRILGKGDPVPGLLREFEAAHAGVRVKGEALPWTSDDQHQLYVINLEGRSPGFDVMMLDCIWVPEFARAGWLVDLTARLTPDELAPYFASAVTAGRYDGRVWALPWNMNVGLLYYRSDLLARYGLRPPETYEELVAAVGRIRDAEKNPALEGYLWQGKQYEGLVVNVLEALWANGTGLFGEDGAILPDPARAADALRFLRGLIETNVSPAWTTAADEELSRRAFGDGHAIFLRNWPYAMDLFEAPGSPVRGKVGFVSLPGRARGAAGVGSTGGAHLAVSRRSRHPELAVALARHLTSRTAQRAIALGAALSPTRRDLYHDAELVRAHPGMPRLDELMVAGRPRPVTPAYLLVSSTVQPEFSAALVGVKSPERAIADARARLRYFLESLR
jgi:multiple sugar transport system substrate-binding protein